MSKSKEFLQNLSEALFDPFTCGWVKSDVEELFLTNEELVEKMETLLHDLSGKNDELDITGLMNTRQTRDLVEETEFLRARLKNYKKMLAKNIGLLGGCK